jgi:putative flippase GtrA
MKQFAIRVFTKYGEIIRYIVVGFINTVLNIMLFWFLTNVLFINYLVSNAVSWCVCVMLVFLGNKYVVFSQREGGIGKLASEATMFFAFRAFSGLLDMALIYIFVDALTWNNMVAKGLDTVIIVIINYLSTKFVVFKTKQQHDQGDV